MAPKIQSNAGTAGAASKADNKVVFLIWNEQRAWVVHPSSHGALMSKLTGANATLTKEEVKAALKTQSQFNIIPGMHEYEARLWDMVKDHEDVIAALEEGRLVLATNEDFGMKGEAAKAPAQSLPESLVQLSTPDAKVLAENCQDLPTLLKWQEAEKKAQGRVSVLDILKAQIEIVEEIDKKQKAATN